MNIDYTNGMVRRALYDAVPHVNRGNWTKINCLGPNVRLHVGRFDSDGNKKPSHITFSYYITNDGDIKREDLIF